MAACTSRHVFLVYSDGLPKHMGPVHTAMSSDPKRMCGLQDMLGHREPATWDQHIQDKLGRAPSRWPLLGSSGSRPLHVLTRQGVHGPNTPQCWPVLVRHGGHKNDDNGKVAAALPTSRRPATIVTKRPPDRMQVALQRSECTW